MPAGLAWSRLAPPGHPQAPHPPCAAPEPQLPTHAGTPSPGLGSGRTLGRVPLPPRAAASLLLHSWLPFRGQLAMETQASPQAPPAQGLHQAPASAGLWGSRVSSGLTRIPSHSPHPLPFLPAPARPRPPICCPLAACGPVPPVLAVAHPCAVAVPPSHLLVVCCHLPSLPGTCLRPHPRPLRPRGWTGQLPLRPACGPVPWRTSGVYSSSAP